MHEIFVNYRTNDAHDAAFAIQADLSRRFGADKVFYASRSIRHGKPFGQELILEVTKARVLLAVIGPEWLKRDADGRRLVDDEKDWVRREIVAALKAGTQVIPILVDRKTDRLPADLPADLKALTSFNYRRFDHREAEAQLPQIAAAVQEVVPDLVDSTVPQPEPPSPGGITTTNQSGGFTIGNQSGGFNIGTQTGTSNFGNTVNTGGGTYIGSSRGNIHTGSGTQFNLTPADDDPDDEK